MKKTIEYMGTWSISPEGAGVSIDQNGKVILPQNTGTQDITYTITYIDTTIGCETTATAIVKACSTPTTCTMSAIPKTDISWTQGTNVNVGTYERSSKCSGPISSSFESGNNFLTNFSFSNGVIYANVEQNEVTSARSGTYKIYYNTDSEYIEKTFTQQAYVDPSSNTMLYIYYEKDGIEGVGIIACESSSSCIPSWIDTRYYLEDESIVVTSAKYGKRPNITGVDTFSNFSGLTAVTIPDNIKNISNSTFKNCVNLQTVEFSWYIRTIGEYAFSHCHKLTSVDITDHYLTSIGRGAFQYCSGLTSFDISSNLTEISDYLFEYCTSLTTINIPSSITTIGQRAFLGCSGLITCSIGSSVTSIGDNAFYYCQNLNSIVIYALTPPALGTGVFELTNCNIYVPNDSVTDYKTAWNGKIDNVERIKPISESPTN